MPYRPKINEFLPKGSYEYIGSGKLVGINHRFYKSKGRIYHHTITNLIAHGYRIGTLEDGVLQIARPSQMRSYRTE